MKDLLISVKRKKAEIKNKRKQSEPNFILSVWFSFLFKAVKTQIFSAM